MAKGVSSALLEKAEELVKVRECTRIHLETHSKDAQRLYERTGYRVFGELTNYQSTESPYYLAKLLR